MTRTTDIFGSPMYMSPEQLKASRDVDARADIWALGVILYELITGKAPFDRNTVAETFGAILYEKPASLRKIVPEIPEGLERVIFHCLEKDVSARVTNVAELSKALFPFAAHATRASLERTSRVLRRAGVTVDTVPPPPSLARDGGAEGSSPGSAPTSTSAAEPAGAASGRTNVSPAAQTRTAWDSGAQQAPRARASTRAAFVTSVALVLLGGAASSRTSAGGGSSRPRGPRIARSQRRRRSLRRRPRRRLLGLRRPRPRWRLRRSLRACPRRLRRPPPSWRHRP